MNLNERNNELSFFFYFIFVFQMTWEFMTAPATCEDKRKYKDLMTRPLFYGKKQTQKKSCLSLIWTIRNSTSLSYISRDINFMNHFKWLIKAEKQQTIIKTTQFLFRIQNNGIKIIQNMKKEWRAPFLFIGVLLYFRITNFNINALEKGL